MIHLLNDFDLTAIHRLFNAMDDALSPAGDATDEEKAAFHIQGLSYSDVVWKDITPEQFTAMEEAFFTECEKIADDMERSEEAGEPIDTKLMPKHREDIKKISTFYKHFAAVMATPHYRIIPYMGSPDTFAHTFAPIKDTGKPLYTFKAKTFAELDIEQDLSIWAETLSYPNYYTDNGALPMTPAQLHKDANTVYYNISGQDLCEQWLSRSKVRDMEELLKRTAAEGGVEGFKYINDGINYEIDVVFVMATRIYAAYKYKIDTLPSSANSGEINEYYVANDIISGSIFSGDATPDTECTVYPAKGGKNTAPISATYNFNELLDEIIEAGAAHISKPLDYYDRMVFNACCTYRILNGENARPVTLKQLYEILHRQGYATNVSAAGLERLRTSIERLQRIFITIDVTELANKWQKGHLKNDFALIAPTANSGKYMMKGYLLPIEIVEAQDRNGNITNCAYNIIKMPCLMELAKVMKQVISYSPKYFEIKKYDAAGKEIGEPSRADSNTIVTDYLLMRLRQMESANANKRIITHTIAYSELFKITGVKGEKQEERTREKVRTVLKSWQMDNLIKGYTENLPKAAAGQDKEKNHGRAISVTIDIL